MQLGDITNPRVRDMIRAKLDEQSASLPKSLEVVAEYCEMRGGERELQAQVEAHLLDCGYLRMTAESYKRVLEDPSLPCNGFFGHWTNCEGNPFVPDLLVVSWPNYRPPLLLELKVAPVYRAGQKQAITLGAWHVAFDYSEAVTAIAHWEGRA